MKDFNAGISCLSRTVLFLLVFWQECNFCGGRQSTKMRFGIENTNTAVHISTAVFTVQQYFTANDKIASRARYVGFGGFGRKGMTRELKVDAISA